MNRTRIDAGTTPDLPQSGIEDPQAKKSAQSYQHQGNGDDRRAENKNNAGRVVRPDEKRQAKPRHAGARILWIVTMKLSPVRIEEKPVIKTPTTVRTTWVLE